ncbi:MAG: prepilin peptidase [Lachnospiraceae bacterium]|nr:prepilin peptidase [Lachnospiraceae bacterium]
MRFIILLILVLSGAVAMDFLTDKIPNRYILLSSFAVLAFRIIDSKSFDFFGIVFSVFFPVLILFPLFVFGFFGGADLKLIGMLGICFPFKDVMCIFVLSLFAGLFIGLAKALVTRSFFQRFKTLFLFSKNVFYKALTKNEEVFESSYIGSIDPEMLKKGSIHFSLPILIAVVLKICIGG